MAQPDAETASTMTKIAEMKRVLNTDGFLDEAATKPLLLGFRELLGEFVDAALSGIGVPVIGIDFESLLVGMQSKFRFAQFSVGAAQPVKSDRRFRMLSDIIGAIL